MAIKKPLVMYAGVMKQLQFGDVVLDSHTNSIAIKNENDLNNTIKNSDLNTEYSIYVDKSRTDDYVEDGNINRPFKSINAALSIATNKSIVIINYEIYNEDIIIPNGVSLQGCGSNQTEINGNVTTTNGDSITLRSLKFSGNNNQIEINTGCSIFDCFINSALVGKLSANIRCWNTHVTANNLNSAIKWESTGNFQSFFSNISNDGNGIAINQSNGHIILNSCIISGENDVDALYYMSDGVVYLTACQITNYLDGPAIDLSLSGAIMSQPNRLADLLCSGDVICADKPTIISDINFISVGNLSGSALLFKNASMVNNDSSVNGDTVKTALETNNSIAKAVSDAVLNLYSE